jgi:hypothetical protein
MSLEGITSGDLQIGLPFVAKATLQQVRLGIENPFIALCDPFKDKTPRRTFSQIVISLVPEPHTEVDGRFELVWALSTRGKLRSMNRAQTKEDVRTVRLASISMRNVQAQKGRSNPDFYLKGSVLFRAKFNAREPYLCWQVRCSDD